MSLQTDRDETQRERKTDFLFFTFGGWSNWNASMSRISPLAPDCQLVRSKTSTFLSRQTSINDRYSQRKRRKSACTFDLIEQKYSFVDQFYRRYLIKNSRETRTFSHYWTVVVIISIEDKTRPDESSTLI